mmetsp:Transcript_13063/g.30124  ORF Transcript_13063/g.30124 Transcript_13063/m.30124 type:complete len:121 (+) Transcript_13063:368-730(+)
MVYPTPEEAPPVGGACRKILLVVLATVHPFSLSLPILLRAVQLRYSDNPCARIASRTKGSRGSCGTNCFCPLLACIYRPPTPRSSSFLRDTNEQEHGVYYNYYHALGSISSLSDQPFVRP